MWTSRCWRRCWTLWDSTCPPRCLPGKGCPSAASQVAPNQHFLHVPTLPTITCPPGCLSGWFLCGAKINPKVLYMEQKLTQKSCTWSKNYKYHVLEHCIVGFSLTIPHAMWRNFRLNAEIVPFKCGENLSHGEISPHEKCGDKSVNIMCTIFDVLSHFMLFCCKIFLLCDLCCFVAKCGEKRTNMRYDRTNHHRHRQCHHNCQSSCYLKIINANVLNV